MTYNVKTHFSVVIATHNRDNFLKRALDSVVKQKLPPLDVIVVDDVPNKSTEECVAQYAQDYDMDIRYVQNLCEERTWWVSRNLAASYTKGDYIASLDDDDFWSEAYLEKVDEVIDRHHVEIVLSECTNIGPEGIKRRGKIPPDRYSQELCYLINPGYLPSGYVVRKDKFLQIGGYDSRASGSADKDLIMQLCNIGCQYKVIHQELVYRWTGDEHTQGSSDSLLITKYTIAFYRKYFKEMTLIYHLRMLKKICRLYFVGFGLKKYLKRIYKL